MAYFTKEHKEDLHRHSKDTLINALESYSEKDNKLTMGVHNIIEQMKYDNVDGSKDQDIFCLTALLEEV